MYRALLSLILIAFVCLSVSSFSEQSLFIADHSKFSAHYAETDTDIYRNTYSVADILVLRQYQTAKKPFDVSWHIFAIDKSFDSPHYLSHLNKNANVIVSYHPAPLQFFEVLVI